MALVRGQRAWDASDMPSQAGRVVIVTGANSGIGYFAARALAARGARVILACRSESKGRGAAAEMTAFLEQELQQQRSGDHPERGSVEFMQVDMASLESVRAFAASFRQRVGALDLLINNAGVALPAEERTKDGLEAHFGVNHLSHFCLTGLLFDLLRASPAARVVNISSLAHQTAVIDFPTLAHATDGRWNRYRRSKLANLLFTYELQRRLEAAGIEHVLSVASHPGLTYTMLADKLIDKLIPTFMQGLVRWLTSRLLPIQSAEAGALTTLYAATAPGIKNGDYVGPRDCGGRWGPPVLEQSMPNSHSPEDAETLWALSEQLSGGPFRIHA